MGYVTAKQAALAWERDLTIVREFCRRGLIPGARKDERGRWWIPEGDEPPGLHRRAKLTEEDRREIARLARAGGNQARLGRAYGVSRHTVRRMKQKYPRN